VRNAGHYFYGRRVGNRTYKLDTAYGKNGPDLWGDRAAAASHFGRKYDWVPKDNINNESME
jgi:hypothetical protein